MVDFCVSAKGNGIRNETNYETFKAVEAIINNIERYHPAKVRDALFVFLEKFTN